MVCKYIKYLKTMYIFMLHAKLYHMMYFIIKSWNEVLVEGKSLVKVNQETKTEYCKRICRGKKPRSHKVSSYLRDKKKLEKEVI